MMKKSHNDGVDGYSTAYSKALLDGDADGAEAAVRDAMRGGLSAREVYLDLLLPGLSSIGDMWHRGEINVAQEHLATHTSLGILERVSALTETGRPRGVWAVIAAVAGEQHFVGARTFANFLKMDGWEVDFLGADTPAADLGQFLRDRGPELVVLCVTLPGHLQSALDTASHLRSLSGGWKVMIAGPSAAGAEAGETVDGVATDMIEGIALAADLVGAEQAGLELDDVLSGLGMKILMLRKGLSITQAELAAKSDLDRAYISAVEGGKQNISVAALVRLAAALEVEPRALLPS